jgi:hypothetical protein
VLAVQVWVGVQMRHRMLVEVVQRDADLIAQQCLKRSGHQPARAAIGVRFCGPADDLTGIQWALDTLCTRKQQLAARRRAAGACTDSSNAGNGSRDWGNAGNVTLRGGRGAARDAAQADKVAVQKIAKAASALAAARLAQAQLGAGVVSPAALEGAAMRADMETCESAKVVVEAVQIASAFAISKPVLEALQSERILQPPFGHVLFAKGKPAPRCLPPPSWENDEATAGWLQQRLDSMDPAQKQAFDEALSREVALIQGPPGMQPFHSTCYCDHEFGTQVG